MKEYNKNIIKIVIDDHIDEKDNDYLIEIEKAASDPRFANNEERDAQFHKALNKKLDNGKSKICKKTLLRAASVFLALLIGLSVMTLTVKGFREKLWELLSNLGNPSYSLFVSSKDSAGKFFSSYQGQYIPTWIPEGYEVASIENNAYCSIIVFKNSDGNKINYAEHAKEDEKKFNLNKEECDSFETHNIDNKEIIVATKNGITHLVVKEIDALIYVTFSDKNLDIIGFATHIEKK